MSVATFLLSQQQLIIKDNRIMSTPVLKSLCEKQQHGDYDEFALVALVLNGTCLDYGLKPVEGDVNSDSACLLKMWELKYHVPESMYLPLSAVESGSATLMFRGIPMKRYIFVYSSAWINKPGQEPVHIHGPYGHFDIHEFFSRGENGYTASNVMTLVSDLKSQVVYPSLTSAAGTLGRTLRLSILGLPTEILDNILQRLDAKDLACLGISCKTMNGISSIDSIWNPVFCSVFEVPPEVVRKNGESMKTCFGRLMKSRKESQQRQKHVSPVRMPTFGRPFHGPHSRMSLTLGCYVSGDIDRLPFPDLNTSHVFGFQNPTFFSNQHRRGPSWRLL